MIYHSIQDYLTAYEEYNKTALRYDGENFYEFVNGTWVMNNDFYIKSPSYQILPPSNPDGTFVNHGCVARKGQK